MKKLVFVLAGLSALSACSDHRDQRVSTTGSSAPVPDLTLPDTNLARDTSVTASSTTEQPISPIEPQTTRAESPKPKPVTPRRKHAVKAAQRSNPPRDTAVKAYAPNVATNTPVPASTTRDTVTVSPVESSTPVARSSHPDSAKAAAPARDTTQPSDTSAAGAADTASTHRDTTPRDTTAAPPSTMAAASPSNTSSSSTAARTLPIGTEIHAALDDSITSRRDTAGQQVAGHVMENVTGPSGQTLIAAGTLVRFTITRIRPAFSKSSQGRLALQADAITLNGRFQPVQADMQPVPRELRGRGVTGSEAAKVGGGAAAGAVLGRVVGGNTKGAVIGGVAGAAAGAIVANQTATRDVVVKAKTPLVLVLTAPLLAP
jgi:hypothetical protein